MADLIPDMKRAGPRWYWWAFIFAAIVVLAISIGFALLIFPPTPPRTLVMTTGPVGSAFEEFGKRYQAVLAQSGVQLRLEPSAGAIENLARLNDPDSEVRRVLDKEFTIQRNPAAGTKPSVYYIV